MITITFPAAYLPALLFWMILIVTGFDALSEPIADLIRRKAQTIADVMASVIVGLLFVSVGTFGLVVTWPK